MSAAFAQAAASYFGLSTDVVGKADVFTVEGRMAVAFECVLSDADVLAIADRMRQMQGDQPVVKELAPVVPSYEEIFRNPTWPLSQDPDTRARQVQVMAFGTAWDDLTGREQSIFRSRHNYCLHKARLADEKAAGVTSNADDFGGMPG